MTKEEFYDSLRITHVSKGEIFICIYTLGKEKTRLDVKYIYGRIKLNVGPETVGTFLKDFELQLKDTKEDMYIRFLDEYDNKVDNIKVY